MGIPFLFMRLKWLRGFESANVEEQHHPFPIASIGTGPYSLGTYCLTSFLTSK